MPDLPVSASTDETSTVPGPVPVRLDSPGVVAMQGPAATAAANAQRIMMQWTADQAAAAGNSVK